MSEKATQNSSLHAVFLFAKNWLVPFVFLFALTVLFRLPNLLSRSLWFDGDEGLVGIMARDWSNGTAFPTYFYGQNYGFSLFEVLSVAFWIKLLGSTVMALRLGGLMVFALAGTFLFKAFERKNLSRLWSLILVSLFLSFPTWIMWGGMVRGGYVSALLSTSILVYLFTSIHYNWKWIAAASFFFAAAFESHVFILIPVLPFLLKTWLDSQYTWKQLFVCLLGAGLWMVLIRASNRYDLNWNGPEFFHSADTIVTNLGLIFINLPEIFGDFFFYMEILTPPSWWYIFLIFALVLLAFFVGIIFWKNWSWEKGLWFVCLLVLIGITLVFDNFSPRYLLGFFNGFLLFIFFTFFQNQEGKAKWILIPLLTIQLIGIGVGSKIKRDWYPFDGNQVEAFETLYQEVIGQGKKAVFMTDNLGQWQWNYLYGEDIPCSIFRRTERVNRFCEKVYEHYDSNENEVALIGLWGIFWEMDYVPGFNDHRYQVGEKYFYMGEEISRFTPAGEKNMRE